MKIRKKEKKREEEKEKKVESRKDVKKMRVAKLNNPNSVFRVYINKPKFCKQRNLSNNFKTYLFTFISNN
jgi:hypothetical protein